jgi:hypothetical protein
MPLPASVCSGFRRSALSRRDLLRAGTLALGAGSCLTLPRLLANPSLPKGKAKACILLFMWGGPSQLDTWDPKPSAPAEIRGEFQTIPTTVPGLMISEHLPHLARQAHRYAVIRSLTHDDPAHLSSVHHLMTGRRALRFPSDADPPSRKDWPHVGAFLQKLRGGEPGALPPFMTVPWVVSHPAAPGGTAPGQNGGWLGPAYDPFVIPGDPNASAFAVAGLSLPGDLSVEQLDARQKLLLAFDRQQRDLEQSAAAQGFQSLQAKALDVVVAPAVRAAFDLGRETPRTRDRYGRHLHGQAVLLARRLVEAGVSLVVVNWHQDNAAFWDTHGNNFNRLKNDLLPPSDRAFAALLDDLDARGLLDSTLVAWVGEFGRAPKITAGNAGREHWPRCYSAVLAGGGVRGGQVFGSSDAHAAFPKSSPVGPADLTATIYHALGIAPDQIVQDRENRPVRLTEGEPILSLF